MREGKYGKLSCTHTRICQGDPVAGGGVAGTAADVAHDILQVSADILRVVPIAGLDEAARLLLQIWQAIQAVKVRT